MAIWWTIFWNKTPKAQTRSRRTYAPVFLVQLAKEMDTVGNMLDLNKREIITLALNDFLDKAHNTLTEFKAWPSDVEEAE